MLAYIKEKDVDEDTCEYVEFVTSFLVKELQASKLMIEAQKLGFGGAIRHDIIAPGATPIKDSRTSSPSYETRTLEDTSEINTPNHHSPQLAADKFIAVSSELEMLKGLIISIKRRLESAGVRIPELENTLIHSIKFEENS